MLRYRKLIFIILLAVWITLLILTNTVIGPHGIVGTATTIFILVWIGVTIFTLTYPKTARKRLILIYNKTCRPDLLIQKTKKIIDSVWSFNADIYFAKLWTVVALIEMGNREEAESFLKSIDYSKLSKYVILGDVSYTQNLYMLNVYNKKFEEAEANREAIQRLKEKYHKPEYIAAINGFIEQGIYRMAYGKGEYERCKDFYFMIYQNKLQSMRNRVCAAYILGVINEQWNDLEAARGYYYFAVQNGGTMDAKNKAIERYEKDLSKNEMVG